MTAPTQHEFHPDAERLSAFAEQALGQRERADIFAHLAVCSRCRQIVALAREAADAEAATPAAPPRKSVAPSAWWKQWRLVWVPTAIVLAFTAASISVYIEQADRHASEFKVTTQNPAQGTPPASTPPTEQAESTPPAAAVPPPPAAKPAPANAEKPAPPQPSPDITAQAPPEPGVIDRQELAHEPPPSSSAQAQQSPPQSEMEIHGSSYSQPAAAAWQAEQKRQAQADTAHMRVFTAKSTPAAHGADGGAPPAAAQTITIDTTAPAEPRPTAFTSSPAPPNGNSSWEFSTSAKPFLLPSGLAAVSIASGDRFLLAIDTAGTLFLSGDRGVTWQRIATQWTGRAVAVRGEAVANGALQTAPAAQYAPNNNSSSDTGAAPPPSSAFELSNDKNQTWVSTDGQTWTPK